jgi:predicted CXXCH cytochrome family protein
MNINVLFPIAIFCLTLALPVYGADTCVTAACHGAIGSLKYPHEPVKEGDCSSCHRRRAKEHPVKGEKGFEPTLKGAALCSQCHDAMGKKKVVHSPVKDGDCIACHKPHGAANRYLLDVGADRTELCLGCHESAPFKMKFMHGPTAVGECINCHDPHESSEKALLIAPVRNLCLQCHSEFTKALKESPVVHPPVKDGPCTSCHNPHGSAVASLLKKKMPDLCIECHDDIGNKLSSIKVPHKPLLNERSCANCHGAHYSQAKGLLPTDEKSLCLGCHDTDNLGKPPLRNIKKDITGKKYLHGPIQNGGCKQCHDPHGSNYFRILKGNYPEELYAPYKEGIYGLCLNCHDKDLLRSPNTTVNTKFRNGDQNLHYRHVADKRKGRSCRLCHEAHASDGEKLISTQGAKFGDWRIPVNFKITPTGGSCMPGCHKAYKYDRKQPVNYRQN